MGATSDRPIVNFKAIAVTLVLAALLLTGLATTFGFGPFGHQHGTDRVATRQAPIATSTAPPALASSSSQAALSETMSPPAANTAVEEVRSLPRKLAHVSKRRAHRFESPRPSVAIDVVSHQDGSSAEPTAHIQQDASNSLDHLTAHVDRTTAIDTVAGAVVASPEADHEAPDRVAVQGPVSQPVELTTSVFDNPTELHPISDGELAALTAANEAVGVDVETPST